MSEELTTVSAKEKYPWSVKTEVVTRYMSVGNMRLVSEVMNIPYNTLVDWKREPWWADLVEEVRKAKRSKTNNKITKIIEDSLELIQDRIENGDFILNNKTGAVERKPVPLRDVANVTNQLLTRQLQLEELSDKMEQRNETVQETLKLLAKEFSKWQRIQNRSGATDVDPLIKSNSTVVEVKENDLALHDQWEARLQEGSGEVYEQAFSGEEESGAEQSSSYDGESR